MENAAKWHWPSFDQVYMKDYFVSQQSNIKFDELQQEVYAALAERDAALLEKNHANAECNSALVQRDIAYADKHAALVERDNALAALSMIQEDENNPESAAKLMQAVNNAADHFLEGGDLLCLPTPNSCMDSNYTEGTLPLRREKQLVKKAEKTSTKRKDNSALSQPQKGSKASRKRQRTQDGQERLAKGEKIKRQDEGMLSYDLHIDLSSTALPYCSCTGVNRQCYKWGSGGWQSSCCTHSLSEYPLPMNNAKRGSRVAGRKMSRGAFRKLLEKSAGDGVDITQPMDLKDHWAKHGTNRYIIVK